MSDEISKFFQYRDKKTADVMYMQVVERLQNGQYKCARISDGRTVIASKANPSDEFVKKTWVTVIFLGASKATVGGGYVIISRAPQEQKGVSGTFPVTDDEQGDGVTVSGWNPDPLEIVAGGAPGTIDIYGSGFTAGPLSVGDGVSEFSPAVVAPDDLTLTLQAVDSAEPGFRDIVIKPGLIAREAVLVTPAADLGLVGIWATTFNGSLAHIIPNYTSGILNDYAITEFTPPGGGVPAGITKTPLGIRAVVGDHLVKVDADGNVTYASGIPPADSKSGLAYMGGKLWYGRSDSDQRLVELTLDGSSFVTHEVDDTRQIFGITPDVDDVHLWLGCDDILYRYDISDDSVDSVAVHCIGTVTESVFLDPGFIWGIEWDTTVAFRIDKSDLSVTFGSGPIASYTSDGHVMYTACAGPGDVSVGSYFSTVAMWQNNVADPGEFVGGGFIPGVSYPYVGTYGLGNIAINGYQIQHSSQPFGSQGALITGSGGIWDMQLIGAGNFFVADDIGIAWAVYILAP